MKKAIFDLDGTLALIDHRRHYVENGNKDWDSFFKACVNDKPNTPIINLYKMLMKTHEVFIFSGRSDAVIEETLEWLANETGIDHHNILMRPEGDYTPDVELKRYWVKELEINPKDVEIVFDDRQCVVDMWRELGFTCLQVAPGNF